MCVHLLTTFNWKAVSGVYVLTHLLSYREAVVAEQVAVDEEELKELQRPWHSAHVDVGLVKEPLEG